MSGVKQMTTRKCLAAQEGLCYHCDSPCIACGTKKFSVNEDCELCLYCEDQYPIKQKKKKYEKPDIREAIVIVEERPTVILLKGASK